MVVSDIFYFHPYLGKIPNLTNIFQMGWFNHHLVEVSPSNTTRENRDPPNPKPLNHSSLVTVQDESLVVQSSTPRRTRRALTCRRILVKSWNSWGWRCDWLAADWLVFNDDWLMDDGWWKGWKGNNINNNNNNNNNNNSSNNNNNNNKKNKKKNRRRRRRRWRGRRRRGRGRGGGNRIVRRNKHFRWCFLLNMFPDRYDGWKPGTSRRVSWSCIFERIQCGEISSMVFAIQDP